jgi:hypothetical protein
MVMYHKLEGIKTLIVPGSIVCVKYIDVERKSEGVRYIRSIGLFDKLRVTESKMVVLRMKLSKLHSKVYATFNLSSSLVVEVSFFYTPGDVKRKTPYHVFKN